MRREKTKETNQREGGRERERERERGRKGEGGKGREGREGEGRPNAAHASPCRWHFRLFERGRRKKKQETKQIKIKIAFIQ